jgi:tagatose 1,6-diphosphate aldolase
MSGKPFEFFDPGELIDGALQLRLRATAPADPARDWVPSYTFDLVLTGTTQRLGHITLRIGHTRRLDLYSGQVGYAVVAEHRGRRYALRACRLVLPLARRHGLKVLWLTVTPENAASRRTCELLGAEYVEIVDLPPDHELYSRGARQVCRYRLALSP